MNEAEVDKVARGILRETLRRAPSFVLWGIVGKHVLDSRKLSDEDKAAVTARTREITSQKDWLEQFDGSKPTTV